VSLDDRFDELVSALSGFYRTWVVFIGLELGFLPALRGAGSSGMTPDELADRTASRREPVAAWARAAHAFELVSIRDGRIVLDEDVAGVLLDEQRPEYLGGQFVATVVASLDYEGLPDFFRTGRVLGRPPRYRQAIERLTAQDIAVFFQEVLGLMPDLVASLAVGGRVVDVHCGAGRWLVAMARRFPSLELVGVEFETDTAGRALAKVAAAGLTDRIRIEVTEVPAMGHPGEFDLAYLQYALHQLAEPQESLQAVWASLAPDGRLLVLDWCLPSTLEEDRTLLGELLWGVQLDELSMGSRLYTREGFVELFRDAGLPEPTLIDLPSGASLFVVRREA
jgi:SAM-dependent methyltransferase